MNPVDTAVAVVSVVVFAAWFLLTLMSIFLKLKPRGGMRAIELALVVASVLMICCFGAAYLLLHARGAL